ncbi:hypothetical protein [Nocardioides sediminis]|uniref:hypothetical protein n=1 Tax=Nocardioides sediminis TaxID=433648 RepID=UPI000D31C728|nr:hypothetical protein [Nocardioides sediminis]
MKDEGDWEFADAWVLTSIAVSQAPCTLTEVVAAADGLNHAILLDDEVDGAVRRLLGSGLLVVTPDMTFALTSAGSALVARRNGSLFNQVDSVLGLLASVHVRVQEFALPPGAMRDAVDTYLARRGRR